MRTSIVVLTIMTTFSYSYNMMVFSKFSYSYISLTKITIRLTKGVLVLVK